MLLMLSQVSSKDMIARAYDAGIEFFLQKPVNAIEVASVLGNVIRSRDLQQTVDKIQSLFAVSGEEPKSSHDARAPDSQLAHIALSDLVSVLIEEFHLPAVARHADSAHFVDIFHAQVYAARSDGFGKSVVGVVLMVRKIIMPVAASTMAGINEVDPAIVDAATGMVQEPSG